MDDEDLEYHNLMTNHLADAVADFAEYMGQRNSAPPGILVAALGVAHGQIVAAYAKQGHEKEALKSATDTLRQSFDHYRAEDKAEAMQEAQEARQKGSLQ
jgi:hypothetical protein